MSLLMEALKKAEEAKRRNARENGATAPSAQQKPELTLEPLPSTGSRLPDLAQHIDAVDAELAAVPTEPPARPQASPRPIDNNRKESAARTAAHAIFAAKLSRASRNKLWLPLGLGAVTVLSLGAYFWWQLQNIPSGSLALTTPPPASHAVANSSPLPPAQSRHSPPTIPVGKPLDDTPHAPEPPLATTASKLFSAPALAARGEAPRPHGDGPPIRVSRNRALPDTTLEQAYDALRAGKTDAAGQGYENVLRRDPKNTDALLGMATITAMQGQQELARRFYLQAFESNPSDATALAGVISGQGQTDPGLAESRLKIALSSQPDSPSLLFALGNLYARQGRWGEAQQVYFKAYSSEPDNPDFIFNLAVSLDHLHKNRLAAQYYQMALDTAGTRAPAFDSRQVRNRIKELLP